MMINLENLDIATIRDSLLQAILICLFTDAKADAEELPEYFEENRGCWLNDTDFVINNQNKPLNLGSKLWLLENCKITADTLAKAESYCREALQPLLDAGKISKLEITAEQDGERINLLLCYDNQTLNLKGI